MDEVEVGLPMEQYVPVLLEDMVMHRFLGLRLAEGEAISLS
jgi:hypothetical protein